MGCCARSKKVVAARPEQKWDYITLNDFKSKGCGTISAYVYLWFMLFISVAVYGVDTFTAVNLLIFDRWSSEIEPAADFVDRDITKWIFSICIIASFVNLAFEQFRALRIMKRGNIAECYLDNLAVRQESIRMGKGQGFKRFLVFAELTKSKKGAEYIALFTYFSLQSWIRVILCSGPRQVINAMTLYSVYNARLTSDDAENLGEGFLDFFQKIETLASDSYQQALILSAMLFTLVIWAFSALFLLAGILFYICFLFHWIPKADGGLSGYCERKVNNSLTKIVAEKVNKAFEKEERKKLKEELKEARKNGVENPVLGINRQATLPTLPDMDASSTDKLPQMPMLDRTDTTPTLPPYTSRPGSPGNGNIELGAMDKKPPMPPRSGTMASASSYASNAPLVGHEADMGFSGPTSPPASVNSRTRNNNYPPPIRPGTANSQRSMRGPPGHSSTFSSSSSDMPPMPHPLRSPTSRTFDGFNQMGRASPAPSRGGYGEYNTGRSDTMTSGGLTSPTGRQDFGGFGARSASPAPSTLPDPSAAPAALRPGPTPRPGGRPSPPPGPSYQPNRSATGPVPQRGPGPQYAPQRNMTAPIPPRQEDYFDRPGTAQSYRSNPRGPPRGPPPGQGQGYGYDSCDTDVESQRGGWR